jgi:poly(hydroxyalkanoate) granule-associated protein
MAKKKVKSETIIVEEERLERAESPFASLLKATRRTALAGLGAAAMAQDEALNTFERMLERGEEVQQAGRKALRKAGHWRRKEARRAQTEVNQRIEQTLHAMNLPTQGDVEALRAQITLLGQKIDSLKEA